MRKEDEGRGGRREEGGEREKRGGGGKNRDIKCMEKERGEGGK